jgi:hypothetical protein
MNRKHRKKTTKKVRRRATKAKIEQIRNRVAKKKTP